MIVVAHVVVPAGVQGRRVLGWVDSGREAGGVDGIRKGEEPKPSTFGDVMVSRCRNRIPSVEVDV